MAGVDWGQPNEASAGCVECGHSSVVRRDVVIQEHRRDCSHARPVERLIRRDALMVKIARQEQVMCRAEDLKLAYQRELDELGEG